MTYTVYYLIYGVKFDQKLINKLLKHFGVSDIDDLKNSVIQQFYDGDYYIGQELWSTDNCNWIDNKKAKGFPVAKISFKDKFQCHLSIKSFLDSLPKKIAKKVAKPGFYWCSGSS